MPYTQLFSIFFNILNELYFSEAQADVKTTDIFVCGRCHEVYHFVEEFQIHKSQKCCAKSTVLAICEGESKPQVWGFTLWKTKQHRNLKPGEEVPTSWKTYQNWCKLAPIEKNAWISAGQGIQFCSKIGTANVAEVKGKAQSNLDKDPLTLDGFGKFHTLYRSTVCQNQLDILIQSIYFV